jgi:hypothetical protein
MNDTITAVLSSTDVICTTLTNTSHEVLRTNVQARVVFIDEAARALERDALTPMVINNPGIALLPAMRSRSPQRSSAIQDQNVRPTVGKNTETTNTCSIEHFEISKGP